MSDLAAFNSFHEQGKDLYPMLIAWDSVLDLYHYRFIIGQQFAWDEVEIPRKHRLRAQDLIPPQFNHSSHL
ncbi:Hypothetical protein P9303_12161 [Prochlorococcus marinus str. MIT 9303]|uniref:Uncharacterized protein n=1 Tax=Prochlorococcus marinus (strain MIT 9303) TaxID=59922 RepID=A2C905_PROM3|nr:Hypothetical protein P9303_12161 [Prochlorococcus marinus str. MIT 9303]